MRTLRQSPAPACIAAALTLSAAGALLLATSAASRAQEQQERAERQKRTLEERVADLEAQVEALRAEVRQPSGNRSPSTSLRLVPSPRPGDGGALRFEVPGTAYPVPPASPAPPGSRPFEFNGQTYYWVPLEAGEGVGTAATRP